MIVGERYNLTVKRRDWYRRVGKDIEMAIGNKIEIII